MTKPRSLTLAALILSVCAGSASWAQQITNYTTEGNLEATHDIGCADSDQISNGHTPADLYMGLGECLKDGKLEDGVLLFALAGVYGRYDTLRVSDPSAHQATTMLRKTYLDSADESTRTKFGEILQDTLGAPDGLERICSEIRKIGAPDYFPRYMIQHGMKAMTGQSTKDGLVVDFEPEPAWESSLDTYLHCPGV
jgi:hypothetical protein